MMTRLLMVCWLLGGLVTVGAAANLMPDSSLEEGQWELASWNHGQGRHGFASPGRTGDKCAHLVGIKPKPAAINRLAASPVVKVQGGVEYLLTVWYKTAGSGLPSLGVMSYTAPFATAAWKTPQAQYDSNSLGAAPQWKQGVWRFRAAPAAVELRVLLRLGTIGEVWFDDVALVCLEDYDLQTTVGGELSGWPDQRLYQARVQVPSGEAWVLKLINAEGQPAAEKTGSGPLASVAASFRAAAGQSWRAELFQGESLVGFDQFTTPPLVSLELAAGRYRSALYASHLPPALSGRLQCHARPSLREKLSYRVGLWPPGQTAAQGGLVAFKEAAPPFNLKLEQPAAGDWQIVAEVRHEGETVRLAETVKVRPPAPPGAREVIVDDHNRLRVDGKLFYPLGLYGVPDNEELSRPVLEAGHNMALTYMSNPEACRKWLDMCQRLGLLGMVHVPAPFVKDFDEQKLREALRVVANHPALLAYYLYDEPSPGTPGQTPADLKRVYEVIADEDPYHPVALCICVAAYEPLYIESYDILMIDVYPVTHTPRPLATIGTRMQHAWQSTAGRKPVWFIPQTFGYDVVSGLDRKTTWLTPTPAQERAMHYLSLAHGARASVGYCYHVYTEYKPELKEAGKWPWVLGGYLPDKQPVLWAEMVKLGQETRRLEGVFNQPHHAVQVLSEGQVHAGWFYGEGPATLVAVNADETQPRQVEVALPPGLTRPRAVKDLGVGGQLTLVGGKLQLELAPLTALAAEVQF